MDYLTIGLHTESLLQWLSQGGYVWLLGGVALIIFMESACIFTPNLPGDSLLFTLGVILAARNHSIIWVLIVLVAAAVMGYECNRWVGQRLAGRVTALTHRFAWMGRCMDEATRFLVQQDVLSLILARFLPIVRTYVPFMLALGGIEHRRFLLGNVLGGVAWVVLLTGGGYLLGAIPWVQAHYSWVIGGIITVSLLPLAYSVACAWIKKLRGQNTISAD